VLAASLMVLAVESLYFLAPNMKHGFLAPLPGAVFAVSGWILLSDGLSFYFQKFEHLNKTYGVLGGGIALLVWLYWSGFIILLGASLNLEIIKLRRERQAALGRATPSEVRAQAATNAS
jgi:membrane protein